MQIGGSATNWNRRKTKISTAFKWNSRLVKSTSPPRRHRLWFTLHSPQINKSAFGVGEDVGRDEDIRNPRIYRLRQYRIARQRFAGRHDDRQHRVSCRGGHNHCLACRLCFAVAARDRGELFHSDARNAQANAIARRNRDSFGAKALCIENFPVDGLNGVRPVLDGRNACEAISSVKLK